MYFEIVVVVGVQYASNHQLMVSNRMFGVCSITKWVVTISALAVGIIAVLFSKYGFGQFFGFDGTTLRDSARYNIQTGLMNVKVSLFINLVVKLSLLGQQQNHVRFLNAILYRTSKEKHVKK